MLDPKSQDFLMFQALYRQQPLPLLYSIDIWPARNSRLTQRETNHYITRCASDLDGARIITLTRIDLRQSTLEYPALEGLNPWEI